MTEYQHINTSTGTEIAITTLGLDFETYYDDQYSLSRLTTWEYITDPRFKIHMLGVRVNGHRQVLRPEAIADFLANLPRPVELIAQNAMFDGLVLAHHFRWLPDIYHCTMSMSRALFSPHVGAGLAELAERLWPEDPAKRKGDDLEASKGVRDLDSVPGLYDRIAVYCQQDVDLTVDAYHEMVNTHGFPASELPIIDMVIRNSVQPYLDADTALLRRYEAKLIADRQALMAKVLVDCEAFYAAVTDPELKKKFKQKGGKNAETREEWLSKALSSGSRFAEYLCWKGIEPPTKISPTTGKPTWAFSQKDVPFLQLMLRHPELNDIWEAREGLKSNAALSKTQTFLAVADRFDGKLIMPLKVSAAHTHRMGGGEGLNCMTGDHEVLTPQGWVPMQDWGAATPIMQWSPDGRLAFVRAEKVEQPYDGPIIDIDAPVIRGRFTPDHRLPTLSHSRLKDRTAGWVADHTGLQRIPYKGTYTRAETALTPAQVRLLVALAADGCVHDQGHVTWGFRRERKIARLLELLDAAEVKFTQTRYESQTVFYIARRDRPTWLRKGFGPWVLTLDPAGLQALVTELVHWDGTRHHKSGATVVFTTDKAQAEWIVLAGFLAGRTPTMNAYPRPGHPDIWHVYFREGMFTAIRTEDHITHTQHTGTVFCARVPSSYFVIRYRDRIQITGNCQNMNRNAPPDDPAGDLRGGVHRRSLLAPDGMVVTVGDLSNIEARMLAWECNDDELLEIFRTGGDVYSVMAQDIYNRPIHKKTDPFERNVGKVTVLGLGYGMGPPKFQDTLNSGPMGMDPIYFDDPGMYAYIVQTYRAKRWRVPNYWTELDSWLAMMMDRRCRFETHNGLILTHESVWMPNGQRLWYPNLRFEYGRVLYDSRNGPTPTWGGTFTENLTQALAQLVIKDGMCRIESEFRRYHLDIDLVRGQPYWTAANFTSLRLLARGRVALQVHDEIVACVPEPYADELLAKMLELMTAVPDWCPGLPLDAEGGWAKNYSK